MLVLQTAEEGESLSDAAFVLACLRRAKQDVNSGTPSNPEDWAQGEPWLTATARELRTMVVLITKIHSNHNPRAALSWAQKEWHTHAPGDRESFRMIPETSLDLRKQWNSPRPSPHHTQKRTGPQTNDQSRTNKQRTQGQGQTYSAGSQLGSWRPGQSASSGDTAEGAAERTPTQGWTLGSGNRPNPPNPPPAPRRGGRQTWAVREEPNNNTQYVEVRDEETIGEKDGSWHFYQ